MAITIFRKYFIHDIISSEGYINQCTFPQHQSQQLFVVYANKPDKEIKVDFLLGGLIYSHSWHKQNMNSEPFQAHDIFHGLIPENKQNWEWWKRRWQHSLKYNLKIHFLSNNEFHFGFYEGGRGFLCTAWLSLILIGHVWILQKAKV